MLCAAAVSARAETVEMVTYYPLPRSSDRQFGRFHAQRGTIGEPYSLTDPATLPDGTLLVAQRVGIGTQAPISALHVLSGGTDDENDFILDTAGNNWGDAGELSTRRARGTPDNPADVQVGDDLGGMKFFGYVAGAYALGASIDPEVDALPSPGVVPSAIVFRTSLVDRLRITSDGNVAVGRGEFGPMPVSTLEVNGSLGLVSTTVSGNVTLDATHHVVLCNNASAITVALPSTAVSDRRIYVIKKISNNTATVTINPAGSQTIEGAATRTLYLRGDTVRIICAGPVWRVIAENSTIHAARLTRTTTQSILAGSSWRQIIFNSETFDTAVLGDVTNNRITIRRDGFYVVTAEAFIQNLPAGRTWSIQVRRGSSAVLTDSKVLPYDTNPGAQVSETLFLSAGDQITLWVNHSAPSSLNTSNTAPMQPRLAVTEILP